MPLNVQIDHSRQFVTVRGSDVVVLQDIFDYFDRIVVENAMSYPKLVDASAAEPLLSDDDVMAIGARMKAYSQFEPRGPVALVATSPATLVAMRRLMNLGTGPREMRLFRKVHHAMAWLEQKKMEPSIVAVD